MKEKFKVKCSCILYNLFPNVELKRNDCIIQKNKTPKRYATLIDFRKKFKPKSFNLMAPRGDALYCVYMDDGKDLYYTSIKHYFEIVCENDEYIIRDEVLKNTKTYGTVKLLRLITNNHIFIYQTNVKIYNKNNTLIDNALVSEDMFPSLSFVNDYEKIDKDLLEDRFKIAIDYNEYLEIIKSNDFLKTAYAFYDDSFFQHNINTKFLLLFSALETFFNNGPYDITYKLSLYTSILIKDTFSERKEVSKKITDLYAKRSKIAHGTNKGKKQTYISQKDEFELREYVRLVILRYIEWNIKSKQNSQESFIEYIENIIYCGKNPIDYINFY